MDAQSYGDEPSEIGWCFALVEQPCILATLDSALNSAICHFD